MVQGDSLNLMGIFLRKPLGLPLLLLTMLFPAETVALELIWPTPNPAFAKGQGPEYFVQPTQAGTVESALFGCFRNSGTRFHEGLDLKPVLPRSRREATDPIYAALPGVVRLISQVAGNSSYGRYVVLEHPSMIPSIYTLYAHLANISPDLAEGQQVAAGRVLGTMGRSAGGYSIPPERAHLHFEMGLRLSDRFQDWYVRQGFGSNNQHGNFNGMNLTGFDPLRFYETYRNGHLRQPVDFIGREPAALLLRISTTETPWFIKQNPALRLGGLPDHGIVGWEVSFTAYGLPKRWKALTAKEFPDPGPRGSIRLLAYDKALLEKFSCRRLLDSSGNSVQIRSNLRRSLQLLFNLQ
jgi:peptidoglycan LD-endopeptidase LytH